MILYITFGLATPLYYAICQDSIRMYKGVLKHCKKCSFQKINFFDNLLYLTISVGYSHLSYGLKLKNSYRKE